MADYTPNFGVVGADSINRSRAVQTIELTDGINIYPFIKSEDGTIAYSRTIMPFYGIQDSNTNSLNRIIESVSYSETEEAITHEAAVAAGVPVKGASQKLVGIDAMLILRMRKTMSVSGKGRLPTGYTETDRGAYKTLTLSAALGDFSVTMSNAILTNPSEVKQALDWWTYSFELAMVVAQSDGAGATHLVTVDNWDAANLGAIPGNETSNDGAPNYTIAKTINLGLEAWVTQEVSITEYFGTANGQSWE